MATEAELQIVRDYVNAAMAADPVNWVNTVTQAMDEFGVSPTFLQQAFPEVGLADIQAAYNQARPTGLYSTIQADQAQPAAEETESEKIARIAGYYGNQFFGALKSGDRDLALEAIAGARSDFPTYDPYDVAAGNIGGAGLSQELIRTIGGADDIVTADELRAYLARTDTGAGIDNISTRTEGREELTGGATLGGAGNVRTETTIPGVPAYTEQRPSGLSFFPVQRGLGSLRGPAYMPGLLQGSEGFGGTGLSRQQVLAGIDPYARAIEGGMNTDQAIQDYIREVMIPQGLSPAEVAAASPTLSLGATQQAYNQFAPRGVFSTAAPPSPVLPEDFVLQTGAYTLPAIASNIALPEEVQEDAAEPLPVSTPPPRTTEEVREDSGGVIELAEGGKASSNISTYIDRLIASGGTGEDIKGAMNLYGVTPAQVGEAYPQFSLEELTSAYENLQASPAERIRALEKRYSTEEALRQAGSKFDISKFIDDQGRLVGGYSKPMYDRFNRFIGYDFQPYQRDVVFNPRLAEAEARGMSDEEREAARRGLIVRQGLTGVDPYAGGLAGIQAREAVMRNRPRYYSYAEGGLANAAQNLASRGRYGDSVLVHMAPEELSGLRALARAQGNDLTINPRTGLPEAFSLKKLFRAASFILPFIPIPGLFGMSSLLTRSILSGVAAGASAKGKFDFKQALGGGLRAYALGSLGEKMSGAATPGGTPTTPQVTVPEAAAVNPMAAPTVTTPSGDISLASSYTGPGATPVGPQSLSADLTAPLKVGSGYTDVAAAPIFEAPIGPAGGADIPVTGGTLPPGADTVPGRAASIITPEGQGYGQPLTKGTEIAMAGLGGLSIEEGAREQRNYEIEAAAARRDEEERKRRFDELFRRTLGQVRTAKQGGIMKLAKGGVTYMEGGGATGSAGEPRVIRGTGDGMSDSVPATIEGVQEARLANDEFVIPADVVADIGNGSSDAGAKKLYGMMDRIRKARHGTTKQPPEINAEAMMPA